MPEYHFDKDGRLVPGPALKPVEKPETDDISLELVSGDDVEEGKSPDPSIELVGDPDA